MSNQSYLRFVSEMSRITGTDKATIENLVYAVPPADLRAVRNVANLTGQIIGTNETLGLIPEETMFTFGLSIAMTSRALGGAPTVDLSDLADELEAASLQAETTH